MMIIKGTQEEGANDETLEDDEDEMMVIMRMGTLTRMAIIIMHKRK